MKSRLLLTLIFILIFIFKGMIALDTVTQKTQPKSRFTTNYTKLLSLFGKSRFTAAYEITFYLTGEKIRLFLNHENALYHSLVNVV